MAEPLPMVGGAFEPELLVIERDRALLQWDIFSMSKMPRSSSSYDLLEQPPLDTLPAIRNPYSSRRRQLQIRFIAILLYTLVCGCQSRPADHQPAPPHAVATTLPQRSYAAIESGKDNAPPLSPPEGRALEAVLHFHPAENRTQLMYAKYRGMLIMFYSNRHCPSGMVPRAAANFAKGNSDRCPTGYHLLGSENGIYFPGNDGFYGAHVSFINSNDKTFVRLSTTSRVSSMRGNSLSGLGTRRAEPLLAQRRAWNYHRDRRRSEDT